MGQPNLATTSLGLPSRCTPLRSKQPSSAQQESLSQQIRPSPLVLRTRICVQPQCSWTRRERSMQTIFLFRANTQSTSLARRALFLVPIYRRPYPYPAGQVRTQSCNVSFPGRTARSREMCVSVEISLLFHTVAF